METARTDSNQPRRPEEPPGRDAGDAPPFVATQQGPSRLLVAPRFETALRDCGFDDASALRAIVESLQPDASRRAGRAATRVVETSAGPVFVKRALKGGVLAPLFRGRVPRFARAAQEIEVTAVMRERGAPVLEPVVAAGVRDGLGWVAVVGTVLVPNAVDGATALEAVIGRSDAEVSALARRFGEAIRRFHDAGGRHADLAVTNLLFAPGTGEMVRIIDLQGARAGRPPSRTRRRRDLARLKRSIARRASIRPALEIAWPALVAGYDADPAGS